MKLKLEIGNKNENEIEIEIESLKIILIEIKKQTKITKKKPVKLKFIIAVRRYFKIVSTFYSLIITYN